MNGFCQTCGNVAPHHRANCAQGQREAIAAREVFTVEPGRVICLNGRALFRLVPVCVDGRRGLPPAKLDRAAWTVADALQEVARLGLHLDVERVENV